MLFTGSSQSCMKSFPRENVCPVTPLCGLQGTEREPDPRDPLLLCRWKGNELVSCWHSLLSTALKPPQGRSCSQSCVHVAPLCDATCVALEYCQGTRYILGVHTFGVSTVKGRESFGPAGRKNPATGKNWRHLDAPKSPKPDSVIQWERRWLACRTRASNVPSWKGPVCPQSPQYVSERVLVKAPWAQVGKSNMSGKRAFPL